MNRQTLRTIAICVVFANSLPLAAQQQAPVAQAAQTTLSSQTSAGVVEGRVVDATGKPVSNASIRLRDLNTGKLASSIVSNNSGNFTFRSVNPGTYVAELVGGVGGKVLAASQMFPVVAGGAVNTFISIPAALASLGGAIAGHAAVAAVVIASAAAAGILAVQSGDCVSPPCE